MRVYTRTHQFTKTFAARLLIPTISFLVIPAGSAQTKLGLRDAISQALSHRPELRVSLDKVASSNALKTQAGLRPNPRLILQTEDIHTSNFNFGKDAESYAYASQVFEAPRRRRGRVAVANQAVERNRAQADIQRRDLIFDVRQAYWKAEAAEKSRDLYADDDSYFQQIVGYHQARFNEGKISEVDLLRVRLERERVHAAAENANLEAQRALLELARELASPANDSWTLTEDFQTLEFPLELSGQTDLLMLRPEGRSVTAALAEARANIDLQRANGRQDLQGLFGYKRNGPENTVIAGLQITLPVFDRNQGAIAASNADAHAAEEAVSVVRNQIMSEIALARREYQMRRDQYVQTFDPLLKQAVEISDISRAAYREGGLDLLRLLDAERLRVDAQISWINALLAYHESVAGLEYAEGVER